MNEQERSGIESDLSARNHDGIPYAPDQRLLRLADFGCPGAVLACRTESYISLHLFRRGAEVRSSDEVVVSLACYVCAKFAHARVEVRENSAMTTTIETIPQMLSNIGCRQLASEIQN